MIGEFKVLGDHGNQRQKSSLSAAKLKEGGLLPYTVISFAHIQVVIRTPFVVRNTRRYIRKSSWIINYR